MQPRILDPLVRIKLYVVIIADDHEMLALWRSPCTALLLMECFFSHPFAPSVSSISFQILTDRIEPIPVLGWTRSRKSDWNL
jgi:hypothetical protein